MRSGPVWPGPLRNSGRSTKLNALQISPNPPTDCSILSCTLMDMSHRREEELIFITTHHQRAPKSLWLPCFVLIFCEFFCSVLSSLVYIALSQHDSEVNIPPLLLLYALLSEVMKMSGRPPLTKTANPKKNRCGGSNSSGGALLAFNLISVRHHRSPVPCAHTSIKCSVSGACVHVCGRAAWRKNWTGEQGRIGE